jgi:CHAD domain-containing protein
MKQEAQEEEVHVSPASYALERSLRRALRNHKRAQKKLKTEPVHDFRVALRRCRSLAEGFSAIDPDPVWRQLRKAAKRIQRGMSDLRDVQVLQNWLKPLQLASGPAGEALASHFEKKERRARKEARTALDSFRRRRWKRWSRRLPARAELIPAGERRLARLVLGQLAKVIDLHERWSKQPMPESWHELRVTVKRFRYMVESFLPEKSEAWSTQLERAQDLLGEGHDLDVLHALLLKLGRKKSLPKTALRQSLRRVDVEARTRRKEYVSLISECAQRNGRGIHIAESTPATVWNRWRAELEALASVNRRGGEELSRSAASRALRAKAPANQYPDRPRRISSAR